ncbi:MAG: SEL1-like repeat protein [Prosthecobacter sp.]
MTLKDAVQTLKISPPISRGQLTKAYVDGLAEWHPDRVAGDAALAAEAEGKIRQIAEAYGMLNGLPESGYPFKVSASRSKEPSASGIVRPFQAAKIASEPKVIVPVRKAVSLTTLAAYAVVGVVVMGLVGMMMHVRRAGRTAPQAVETAVDAAAPQSQPQAAPSQTTRAASAAPSSPASASAMAGTQMPPAAPAGPVLTFEESQTRALEGDKQAQWHVAQAYEKGEGVEANAEEALKWAFMAAEQGLPAAQMKLGLCFKNGVGVAKDLAEALRWFQQASAAGLENAGYEAALCFLNGGEGVENHGKAVALLRPLAETGHLGAQEQLGMCYRYGEGVTEDLDAAIKWLLPAAEHGSMYAQLELALTYAEKDKTPENLAAAAGWYRKAAEQQEPEAQHLLGEACFSGEGVAQSSTEAVKWWRLAAEQDYADAQDSLGMAYQRGLGVAENMETAVQWFRKAAGHDHAAAKFHLSVCHTIGAGVPEDKVQAAQYCLEAAELGHAAAQNNLGVFCMDGSGVRQDAAEAFKWFTLASAQGDESAADWLAKLKARMTSSQIAEGQRRVRAFTLRKRGQDRPARTMAAAPEAAQPPMQHLPTDNRLDSGVLLTDNFREFGGKGQLILDNGLTDDAYVKVVGGRKLWASFYVRGGDKFTLDHVPDGTYQVLYCTGFDWDPKARDFGRGQQARRHDNSFDFTTTRTTQGSQVTVSTPVITLTLHAVPNGNAPTSEVTLEEFDRF